MKRPDDPKGMGDLPGSLRVALFILEFLTPATFGSRSSATCSRSGRPGSCPSSERITRGDGCGGRCSARSSRSLNSGSGVDQDRQVAPTARGPDPARPRRVSAARAPRRPAALRDCRRPSRGDGRYGMGEFLPDPPSATNHLVDHQAGGAARLPRRIHRGPHRRVRDHSGGYRYRWGESLVSAASVSLDHAVAAMAAREDRHNAPLGAIPRTIGPDRPRRVHHSRGS